MFTDGLNINSGSGTDDSFTNNEISLLSNISIERIRAESANKIRRLKEQIKKIELFLQGENLLQAGDHDLLPNQPQTFLGRISGKLYFHVVFKF